MTVAIENNRLVIRFSQFGPEEYGLFLKAKRLPESAVTFNEADESYTLDAPARFAKMLGVDTVCIGEKDLPLPERMYEDQRQIVTMSLDSKRFACWSDCGLGKTFIGLEFARQVTRRTGGRVLVVTLNEIVNQWLTEAKIFYGDTLPIVRLKTREAMREWCKKGDGTLAITNYEKWNPEDLSRQVVTEARHLAGIVLDESSRLKTGGGKQKWAIIKSCRGIEYKLSMTATPAPNDIMEFASQASFLERMRSEGEIIWTYFRRDEKTHRWTVRPHARQAFFEFMAGWSIYVRDPARYGWDRKTPPIPGPIIKVHEIEPTLEQLDLIPAATAAPDGQTSFVRPSEVNVLQANRLSQIAKGFRYVQGDGVNAKRWVERIPSNKPAIVTDVTWSDARAGLKVLVWTVYDAESEILALMMRDKGLSVECLTGKVKPADRVEMLERFRSGESEVLISRARMLGFGMNLQHVGSMVFSGWTYSYEDYYQAVRRAYRHGQTKAVRVHLPCVKGLEDDMLEAIWRKEGEHLAAIAEMEANYVRALGTIEGKIS